MFLCAGGNVFSCGVGTIREVCFVGVVPWRVCDLVVFWVPCIWWLWVFFLHFCVFRVFLYFGGFSGVFLYLVLRVFGFAVFVVSLVVV